MVGNRTLIDKFEWDISDAQNSPESFARTLCADLTLSKEWEVTHDIYIT